MIRPTRPEEVASLSAVAVAAGLFPADDTAPLGVPSTWARTSDLMDVNCEVAG